MALAKAADTWENWNESYFKTKTKTSAQHLSNPSLIPFLKLYAMKSFLTLPQRNKTTGTKWANSVRIHSGYL